MTTELVAGRLSCKYCMEVDVVFDALKELDGDPIDRFNTIIEQDDPVNFMVQLAWYGYDLREEGK